MKTKNEQRDFFKTQLRLLTPEQRQQASQKIQQQCLALDGFLEHNVYFLFASLPSEPETKTIFDELKKRNKRVAFPIWRQAKGVLDWYEVSRWEDLQKRNHSIREPQGDLKTQVIESQGDCIVLPGLAFDRKGYRLGRGAGMYDRTLSLLPQTSPRIGLFYSVQETPEVVVETHDQRLDWIVTENEVILIPSFLQK